MHIYFLQKQSCICPRTWIDMDRTAILDLEREQLCVSKNTTDTLNSSHPKCPSRLHKRLGENRVGSIYCFLFSGTDTKKNILICCNQTKFNRNNCSLCFFRQPSYTKTLFCGQYLNLQLFHAGKEVPKYLSISSN